MPSNGDSFGGRDLQGEVNYYAFYQQTAAADGVWLDTSGILTSSLHIIGGLTAAESITVHCSNAATKPENTDHEVTKQTITGDGTEQHVAITAPYSRWKKFKKTGAATSTTAYFSGAKR